MGLSRRHRTLAGQYGLLTVANYGTLGISFVTSVLLTTQISQADYGSYRYVINIATMLVSFANLGVFYSTARLLTEADEMQERALYGATIALLLALSLATSFALVVGYLVVGDVWKSFDISYIHALPVLIALMMQRMFVCMLKGSNRIGHLAAQTILPSALTLVAYAFVAVAGGRLSLVVALAIYVASYLVADVYTILSLRIDFGPTMRRQIKRIVREQRQTGLELYKGSLVSVFAGDVLNVLAASIVTRAVYGSYSLALSVSALVMHVPSTLGVVRFKESASRDRISRRELVVTGVSGVLSLMLLNVMIRIAVDVLYNGGYAETPALTALLSIGFLLHGFGDYLNNFLSAHGHGARVKRGAYLSGVTQVLLAALMIPAWGVWGLAVSRVAASTAYCASMGLSYRATTNQEATNGLGPQN